MKFGIGQAVTRTEDLRLVTGEGRFVDDIDKPGMLHAVVVRSNVPHARIARINREDAMKMAGVRAILTGQDYQADGIGGISCHTLFPGMHGKIATQPMPAIAVDRVVHAGMPVALVVAESRKAARDAADLVSVEFEELPSVTDAMAAVDADAPVLWEHAPDNIAFEIALGDGEATQKAIGAAAHVTRLSLRNNRVSANSLETRGIVAEFDPWNGRITIHASTQVPHAIQQDIANAIGIPTNRVRVLAMDVGGGFGMKGGVYPEDILAAWAANRLRASVKWRPDRSESMISDYHGRDEFVEAELATDGDGRIVALRIECNYNIGGYLSTGGGVAPMFAAALATGCYRIPTAQVIARGIYTNTSPTQPYRGAGRPEAAYLIERLLDLAAQETGRDRIEMRRLNMIGRDEMPYQTPLVYTIDSGDYAAVLDTALKISDWAGAGTRKAASQAEGKLHGIGIALHMENAGLVNEFMEVRFDPGGGVTVLAGTFSHGQGHETVYAQMVSEWLGVPFESIRVVQGDTDAVRFGRGTIASRSMINGGASLKVAADQVIDKARSLAAHLLEASKEDVTFSEGVLSIAGTDRKMTIQQVAALSFKPIFPPDLGIGLSGEGEFKLEGYTFPNGCQIAEIEIDPETGVVEPVRIVSVDDFGVVVNPMLLDGQIVGGIAQGLGQALMEDFIYDSAGQPLSGSFMDYAMPRACDVPPITFETLNTETMTNPLGVKGAGESGTVGATPAIISAVLDAVKPLGVEDIPMPATSHRIWTAIQAAKGS
jgi:aerobic carbon-monoxide dehydrogenase large subunit